MGEVALVYNEITGKYEAARFAVGRANPIVTESGTATLTGKTIDGGTIASPTITSPTISGTVTDSLVKNGPAPVAQGAGTSLALTAALHAGKTVYLTDTDGITVTLPAATGTGNKYRVVQGAAVASSQTRFNVTGDDSYIGLAYVVDEDTAAVTAYRAGTDADQLDFNGTTKGGQIGDSVEFEDIAADKWAVRVFATCPAGSNSATPFATGQVS